MTPLFIGSAAAIVTPFDKDGKIDFPLFKSLIEKQIANNTDAVVVCGTTGEGSTLTTQERLRLFNAAAETVSGKIPVICATGSNSTSFSLNLAKEAERLGIDGHLIVTPYYNKTSQSGLVSHYYTLADGLQKPVMLYNVPSRTGMNILPKTYKKLSEHENIVAVKEADTNISKLIKSIVLCGEKLDFYIGNDDLISVAASLGCKGVVSVLANIMPQYTHDMAMLGIKGDCRKCAEMQKNVMELIECLFSDVNPIMIKEVMNRVGLSVGECRLPLGRADEKLCELAERALAPHLSEIQKML